MLQMLMAKDGGQVQRRAKPHLVRQTAAWRCMGEKLEANADANASA